MQAKGYPWLVALILAGFGPALLAQAPKPAPPAFEKAAANSGKTGEPKKTPDVDTSDIDVPKQTQVQVEFVEMSHEALTQLLFMAKPGTANATKLRQKVQDMVAKNEAKVLETQILSARNGQKTTAESIHEFIYPTEYEPPELPMSISNEQPSPTPKKRLTPPFLATAFETRNLGSTIEIEPTLGAGDDSIDLRFIPELVWHTGNNTWVEHKDETGNLTKVQMPDIYTLRLKTQLTCKDGQYILAGTLSPKDSKGEVDLTRKVMVFVKCDILTVR